MISYKIFSYLAISTVILSFDKTGNAPVTLPPETNIAVPLAGNAYVTKAAASASEEIGKNGLVNWSGASTVTSTYFYLAQPGELNIAIKAKVKGTSTVTLTVQDKSFTIKLSGGEHKTYFAGTVHVKEAGYVRVDLKGVNKTGVYFGDVSDIMIGGDATSKGLVFANDPDNFYWSRRGPSCHLNYTTPAADKEYFYSELTVPVGEDKIASYFMANGFGEGYFGIQVNSATERRVLFSVWDPAEGKGQTTLLKKGPEVTAGRFGGEGTGGQSYLKFNWRAGNTYKFLTKGTPDGKGSTVYTSWFFAPETGSWRLISSWSRPDISKYLSGFHGFLENFDPNEGYLSRKALWSNQWVYLASGSWSEVTEFKLTVDATATHKQRLDCTGGVDAGRFFLKNGGFFSDAAAPRTVFTKPATGIRPVIDFNALQ